MHRRIRIAIVSLAFLALPLAVSAQTATDLQTQIAQLTQIIAQLQAQIAATKVGAVSSAPSTNSSSASCVILARNLGAGVSGSDVSALQTFLRDQGFYAANSTGYFGPVTQNALQAWQATYGPVNSGTPDTTGFGFAGPKTRALIQSISCATVSNPPISQPIPQNPVPVPVPVVPVPVYTPRACVFNNVTIQSGETRSFYSVPQASGGGVTCASYLQPRTCTDGTLSGSSGYSYLSCVNVQPTGCTINGVTVAEGASQTFYSQSIVPNGSSCYNYSQARTCTNGVLSGSGAYYLSSCAVTPKPSCTLDSLVVPDGSSSVFYFTQHIPAGEMCSSYAQTRSCSSGTLTGSTTYAYATCSPVSSGTCALDNQVLSSGSSATFYSSGAAPAGQLCSAIAQTRTCTNGTLGGSATYNRASCTNTASCSLGGITLAHGSTTPFYSAATVPFGSTCSSIVQNRTCTNGALSGGESYQYGSCSVNPPTAMAPGVQSQLAALAAALDSLLSGLSSLVR